MKKLNILLFAVVGILLTAMPAFAQAVQPAAADNTAGLKALAAVPKSRFLCRC